MTGPTTIRPCRDRDVDPDPPRARLGQRQDRPDRAGSGARRRGRRDRLDRLDGGARSADAGHPVTDVVERHRIPGVARRPGEDAAPGVHAGILADLRLADHERSSPSSASPRSNSSS